MGWRFQFALMLAAAGAAALAGTLLLTRGLVEVVLMSAIVAVLVGSYLLRRFARRALLYDQPLVDAAGTRPSGAGLTGRPECHRRRCGPTARYGGDANRAGRSR
jgi:hypothetical protein